MQSELKEGSPEHKHDLIELDAHTTRIYELVANMVQRSNYLKDQATRELQEKIEQPSKHSKRRQKQPFNLQKHLLNKRNKRLKN